MAAFHSNFMNSKITLDLQVFLKTLNLIFSKLTICDLNTFRTKPSIVILIKKFL